jgi:hypothetical protein
VVSHAIERICIQISQGYIDIHTGFFVGSLDESDYFQSIYLRIKIQLTDQLEVMGKLAIVPKISLKKFLNYCSKQAVYLIWETEAPYHN